MVKKFYMGESKPGSIEDAILGVWREAAQEVDEYKGPGSDRKRVIRDLSKGKTGAAKSSIKHKADVIRSVGGKAGSIETGVRQRQSKGDDGESDNFRHDDARGAKKGSKYNVPASQDKLANKKPAADRLRIRKATAARQNRPKSAGAGGVGMYTQSYDPTEKLAASFSPEEIENFEMIMNESVSTPEIEAVWAAAAENDMSGEHSFELGTDRYREHTQEMTPGQSEKKEVELDETNKNDKSDDGEGLDAVQKDAVKKKFKDRKDKDIDNDGDEDDSDEFLHKKRKAISKAVDAEESFNLRDTIVNMWTEASSAVNPNDREELDGSKNATGEGGKRTAAKMKRAKEPAPMVATEDMSVEEAQKQKTLSMKEALAKVWGFEEGYGNPHAGDRTARPIPKGKKMRPESKNGKTTETGGKMAEVEIDPELKNKK